MKVENLKNGVLKMSKQQEGTGSLNLSVGEQFEDRERFADSKDMLIREITHRFKNMLSIIQAIAYQVGLVSTDIETFNDSFASRLGGLSTTFDLLVQSNLQPIPTRKLIEAHLQVVLGQNDKVEIYGPDMMLLPNAAQALGMGIYELATNSIKHGAINKNTGNIKITWTADAKEKVFVLIWHENGAEDNDVVAKKGFGHLMLERAIPHTLDGHAKLAVTPVGITWFLKAPLDKVAERMQ